MLRVRINFQFGYGELYCDKDHIVWSGFDFTKKNVVGFAVHLTSDLMQSLTTNGAIANSFFMDDCGIYIKVIYKL